MEKDTLDVVAYAGDNEKELDRGVLLTPDNTIDISTGTIKLKAIFKNIKHRLWPGQFVNVRLLLGIQRNVVTVAATAVQHGPDGLFVYKINRDNTVAIQPIRVERQEDGIYVISDGLSDGAHVVATGQSRLQAGSRVMVRETPAAPAASSAKSGS
jgi:multidrug efflux system membrane fusion protein